ncbi:hypothetical protein FNF29_02373 [Cafeteria roenbergensis]|uniref:NADP-dependent oxidoreductase domain-containing protein n=2 Tax=Cafeteria roenbergensis TaxID=33653 RepID=A0A5A8D559_CAFRO|nr:hypothetical protein FNF29_02373 [Cafeteria roenbergensis]KAA0159894.1 hypothetical protein FNF28_05622 [Cafeteria roenbergensis]|eukprot:KAA0154496.1 hypothetical protein FNF29_02373 [Cafeteria roenbergensis]
MAASAPAASAPAKMPRKTIPGTDIEVSVMCLGTWQFGDPSGTYTKQSEEVEAEIVRQAVAAGVNFIDTAEGYGGGESERSIAKALAAAGVKREDVVLASKVSPENLEPSALRAAVERSLANLKTEFIDLYQIHWPVRGDGWDVAATFGELKKLQEEGKIRAIGVSNFGPADLAAAVATGARISTNQLPYSLAWRAIEHEVTAACSKADVGVMGYSPLAQGLLSGKYAATADVSPAISRSRLFHRDTSPRARHEEEGCEEELWSLVAELRSVAEESGMPVAQIALAWVLAQPNVTSVVFGASKPEHVARNTAAALAPLPASVLGRLSAASDPVKAKIGANCDVWNSKDGGRFR